MPRYTTVGGYPNPNPYGDDLLTCSPTVCRAMARFHRALARKDPKLAAENLRAAELWQGAAAPPVEDISPPGHSPKSAFLKSRTGRE
jgi:hypothetical protein